MFLINGKTLYDVINYEPYDRPTRMQYYRNSLTGKLYREDLPGKDVRFHILEIITDKTMYEYLLSLYVNQSKSTDKITLYTPETDSAVECVFTEDEFRLKKVEGEAELYEGTIAFEEVQVK